MIASRLALLLLVVTVGCAAPASPPRAVAPSGPIPDVIWVPSPPEVIAAMLDLAEVGPGDVVYDLGSGEGEIVIEAARRDGVRAVGVEIDPERIENAHKHAAAAGVTDRVTFLERDLFEVDISAATVVTLYLFPDVNARLLPKLLRELRPGTRIVSHDFGLGDWPAEKTVEVPLDRTRRVFLWRVPEKSPRSRSQ
jgi:cyclopropane fatty-acyl-phospholipid synthase-like methyltransferase